ncbi:unnamed protein product [Cylicocyclus nassatus]|uniref:SCP domain-containing protein n=1 Tax=Cylicocyclus nassatus TaxID=53992 RepID=A0AA36H5F1_CYLNA|nr:unnamed protein product [Cylicocyclus nassatus]
MPEMTVQMREEILEFHNRHRANLGSGIVSSNSRKMPPASNMYKLSWSCLLERKAQSFLRLGDPITKNTLEVLLPSTLNQYSKWLCSQTPTTYDNFVEPALTQWWNKVKDQTGLLYNETTASFGNMAYDRATEVGCSVRKHGNTSYLICIYDLGPETPLDLIYESGQKCQCKAYPNSTCSALDSLCIKN